MFFNSDLDATQAEVSNASYQWLDCDDAFSELRGEINQTFECQGACSYNLAVEITQNNCTDTSDCIVLSVLEINEDVNPGEITLYPNPSSNLVYIRGNTSSSKGGKDRAIGL